VVVTLDQARKHRGRTEIDLLRARRNPDASLRPDIVDAIALNDDDLLAHQPGGVAVEHLPGMNHHGHLTLGREARSAESERE
jgi:hypothetical protein